MISDNYVTGDNIFLRELQNFFFEVLGMMSITHYGAVGDGRTDNYGPLQVAIDDANRRNLNYIYVPYGRFIYTGELRNMGNIVFIGNPNAHIINIRTEEEIEIHQFGTTDQTNIRYYVVDRFYTHTDNNFTDEEKAQVAAYALAASTYMVKGTDYVTAGKKSGTTLGTSATIEGFENEASAAWAHAEGKGTVASEQMAHAEGRETTASGGWAHAEGIGTVASGEGSHAEGAGTTASGAWSHAEGDDTIASAQMAHAEGRATTASGAWSHAEGIGTTASDYSSHAEGVDTIASGYSSHAEGRNSVASNTYSHAEGWQTKSSSMCQHVQGMNNIEDANGVYADVVGGGADESNRKNISTLDWSGNAWFQGDVYVGSTSGTNKDAGSQKLATEVYVMQQIAQIGTLKIEIVQQLPTQDISTDTIYLLPDPGATQGNAYLEYIYINNAWELIGSTQVDLTNYYTKTEVDALILNYTAGTNINITNGVISATDTTYSAGANITIDANNEISATDTKDYEDLTNKPTINNVTLVGNNSLADLGLEIASTINSTSTNDQVAGAKAVYDFAQENYSTTEQRIGTWIDGKPLYQRVFQATTTSSTPEAYVDFMSSASIDTLVKLDGTMRGPDGRAWNASYYKSATDYTNLYYSASSGRINVQSGTSNGFGLCTITVKYTKTADTAS